MTWLYNNWTMLVVIGCAIGVAFFYLRKLSGLPSDEQMKKVREWLLYAVIETERMYQGGTGVLKLRSCYDDFCKVFPSLVPIISFELFSTMVDEALAQMKKILETNENINNYVKGIDNGGE